MPGFLTFTATRVIHQCTDQQVSSMLKYILLMALKELLMPTLALAAAAMTYSRLWRMTAFSLG